MRKLAVLCVAVLGVVLAVGVPARAQQPNFVNFDSVAPSPVEAGTPVAVQVSYTMQTVSGTTQLNGSVSAGTITGFAASPDATLNCTTTATTYSCDVGATDIYQVTYQVDTAGLAGGTTITLTAGETEIGVIQQATVQVESQQASEAFVRVTSICLNADGSTYQLRVRHEGDAAGTPFTGGASPVGYNLQVGGNIVVGSQTISAGQEQLFDIPVGTNGVTAVPTDGWTNLSGGTASTPNTDCPVDPTLPPTTDPDSPTTTAGSGGATGSASGTPSGQLPSTGPGLTSLTSALLGGLLLGAGGLALRLARRS